MKSDYLKKIVIVGGQAGSKVVFDIFSLQSYEIVGFMDNYVKENAWGEINPTLLGSFEDTKNEKLLSSSDIDYFVATGNNYLRSEIISSIIKKYGKKPLNAIHPSTIISKYVEIGFGNLICANAVINVGTKMGAGNIINTSAIIEHDNIVGDYCQISPNATLAGYVKVNDFAFVASGATIIPKITINSHSFIAAGAVVIDDVEENVLVGGCPAKFIKKLKVRGL